MTITKPGDTISTTSPLSPYAGAFANQHIHVILNTPEACQEAGRLIATGRWMLTNCGSSESMQNTPAVALDEP